jgi:hypothetical protein
VGADFTTIMVFGMLIQEKDLPKVEVPAGEAWCEKCHKFVPGRAGKFCIDCGGRLLDQQRDRLGQLAGELFLKTEPSADLGVIGDCGFSTTESVILYADESKIELEPNGGGNHVIDATAVVAMAKDANIRRWNYNILRVLHKANIQAGEPRWYIFSYVSC